jgi:hypothetical protein
MSGNERLLKVVWDSELLVCWHGGMRILWLSACLGFFVVLVEMLSLKQTFNNYLPNSEKLKKRQHFVRTYWRYIQCDECGEIEQNVYPISAQDTLYFISPG